MLSDTIKDSKCKYKCIQSCSLGNACVKIERCKTVCLITVKFILFDNRRHLQDSSFIPWLHIFSIEPIFVLKCVRVVAAFHISAMELSTQSCNGT